MKIKLAELIIELATPDEYTTLMCKDYIYNGEKDADITAICTKEDIEKEKKVSPGFLDKYLENTCIYRNICKEMINFDAMLIHSAAVMVDGEGYLFTALSGTGKTTHVNLWLEKFGERAVIINGDKPIIRKMDKGFRVFGTPWCGKEGINTNTDAPIAGICILKRGTENTIRRITKAEALVQIMNQTVRPKEKERMSRLLDLLERLLKEVPVYELFCNMDISAADVSYNGMSKKV